MKQSFVESDGLILLIKADKKHLVKTMKSEMFLYNVTAQKLSFPLRISSVNATKSAGTCGFRYIY